MMEPADSAAGKRRMIPPRKMRTASGDGKQSINNRDEHRSWRQSDAAVVLSRKS